MLISWDEQAKSRATPSRTDLLSPRHQRQAPHRLATAPALAPSPTPTCHSSASSTKPHRVLLPWHQHDAASVIAAPNKHTLAYLRQVWPAVLNLELLSLSVDQFGLPGARIVGNEQR